MEIKLNKTGNVNAEITITINRGDYEERVTQAMKELRRQASIPGFRPGQAPLGLLKRRFGTEVTAEQVNKLIGEKIYEYIREEKLNVLGDPLPNVEKQQRIDFETMDSMDFIFDVGLAPEFDARLSDKDTIDYYTVTVDDALIDEQVQTYAKRAGEFNEVEEYQPRDMVKGTMTELSEGGLTVEDVLMLPDYMKNEEQKAKFAGAKPGDSIVFNPSVAYEGNQVELSSMLKITKEEAAEKTGDFSFEIKEITRYEPAAITQELFDLVYGEGTVNGEDEFRARIRTELEEQFKGESESKFTRDLRNYLVERIGTLEFPDDILKRVMKIHYPEKEMKEIEDDYPPARDVLFWHMIKDKLAEQFQLKVELEDLRETAKQVTKAQFAKYGMVNLGDDIISKYAEGMFKDKQHVDDLMERAIEQKVVKAALSAVNLNNKSVSREELDKMLSERE